MLFIAASIPCKSESPSDISVVCSGEMCSIAFEQIAALMLFSHHKFYEDYMEELIFPCIRRIVLEVGTKYSTRILYDSIYDVKLGKLFDKLLLESKWYYLIDLEAEIIVILSTALIKIMNGDAKITELYDLVKKQLDCELK